MTAYIYSIAMVIPAELQDKANRLSCALDHDVLPGDTFIVPLSTDGLTPATHYGTLSTAQQSFVDILTAASQGYIPTIPWGDYDLTEQDVADILGALTVDVKPAKTAGHFWLFVENLGLQRVSP